MDAFVHFNVGLSLGLLALTFADGSARNEFALMLASGIWGLIPDGHWILRSSGLDGIADLWLRFHASEMANLFWFHQFLDRHETGRPKLEIAGSLLVLVTASVTYYSFNDWSFTRVRE